LPGGRTKRGRKKRRLELRGEKACRCAPGNWKHAEVSDQRGGRRFMKRKMRGKKRGNKEQSKAFTQRTQALGGGDGGEKKGPLQAEKKRAG